MAFDLQQFMNSLGEMMGSNNSGVGQYSTMPTSFNTSDAWAPPAAAGAANTGLGSLMTLKNGQSLLGGISALSGIINSSKAAGLAKDQFKFTKDVTNTNLNNSIKSYNTALADRATSRAFTQNQDQSVADAYIEKNRLTR